MLTSALLWAACLETSVRRLGSTVLLLGGYLSLLKHTLSLAKFLLVKLISLLVSLVGDVLDCFDNVPFGHDQRVLELGIRHIRIVRYKGLKLANALVFFVLGQARHC